MADDELSELLGELESEVGENDEVVERARESLEATLTSLKLTPEEEAALAGELTQLRDLGRKLDESTIEIAAFGMVSRGKSSVLNAIMGKDVFEVGVTNGTTIARAAQRWQHDEAGRPGLEGAQLVGDLLDDQELLHTAQWCEQAIRTWRQ
jgi:GTPase